MIHRISVILAIIAVFSAIVIPCSAQNAAQAKSRIYAPVPVHKGDTFLPKSPRPSKTLFVVLDSNRLSPGERSALLSLQGLTSRRHPEIWISNSKTIDQDFQLQTMIEAKAIDKCRVVSDWKSLFSTFSGAYKGAVVYDKDFYRSDSIAVTIAGTEDLIATSADVAAELNLPIAIDLRGKFAAYADGLEWVLERDGSKLNRRVALMAHGILSPIAYSIEFRALDIWPSGDVDKEEKGADQNRELQIFTGFLSQMEPNSVMLGYPYGGKEGIGIGEGPGTRLLSQCGISLIASDYLDNLPVLCGVKIDRLKQKRQPFAPPLEKDKIYIALNVSDGDNMSIWKWMCDAYFKKAQYGQFPLAFGMGPAIIDMQPTVAKWYYDHAAPNTEFISDVSGIGYMQPNRYGEFFQNRDELLGGFLDLTNVYMNRLDMRCIRPVSANDKELGEYISHIHPLDSIFDDMGRHYGLMEVENLDYSLNNVPVLHSATSWRYGKTGILKEIREQTDSTRPAFVNAFVHLWTFDMDTLANAYAARDADMVFVTPRQLAALYKEARAKGWTK